MAMVAWIPVWFLIITSSPDGVSKNSYQLTFSTKQKCELALKQAYKANAEKSIFNRDKLSGMCIAGEAPVSKIK